MTSAAEAYNHAQAAHEKVEAHEDLCAERYAHINTKLDGVNATVGTILKILAWGGTTIFGLLMGCLVFFATRSLSTNDAQIDALKDQVEALQTQQTDHPD